MTKQEFVDAVADKAGLSKRDASAAVDAALDVIQGTLQNGDRSPSPGSASSTSHGVRRARA